MLVDDAIDVHPVKDGLGLGGLDGVHVHLFPSLRNQDGWTVADILL